MKTKRVPTAIESLVAAVALAVGTSAFRSDAQTNLLLNGSFEGPNISPAAVSSLTPSSWSSPGGGLIINPASFDANQPSYFPLPATDGSQVFELSSSSSLSQTIALTTGQPYDFSFDLSALQLQDGPATFDAAVDLNITDNTSDNFNRTFSISAGTTSWRRQIFDFTASDSANYLITVKTPASGASILDNAFLRTGVAPEPSTTALLGLGLPMLFLFLRRATLQK